MATLNGVSSCRHRVEQALGSLPDAEQDAIRKICRLQGYCRAMAVIQYLKNNQAKGRSVVISAEGN